MRRCYIDWLKFLPTNHSIDVVRVNSDCSDQYSKEHWYKDEKTFRIVMNEYFKLRGEWLIDIMISQEK
jgi:hypothetical protein